MKGITKGAATVTGLTAALAFGGAAEAGGHHRIVEGTPRVHTSYETHTQCETVRIPQTTVVTPRRVKGKLPCYGDEIWNGILRGGQHLLELLRVPACDGIGFNIPLPPRVDSHRGCATAYDSCAPSFAPAQSYGCNTCDPHETGYNNHLIAPTQGPTPAPNLAPEFSPGPAVDPNNTLYGPQPTGPSAGP